MMGMAWSRAVERPSGSLVGDSPVKMLERGAMKYVRESFAYRLMKIRGGRRGKGAAIRV